MKKVKKELFTLPVFMAIPVLALVLSLYNGTDCESLVLLVWFWQSILFVLSMVVSIVSIHIFHIQFKKAYKDTLSTDIVLLLWAVIVSVIMFGLRNEYVSAAISIIYPILCGYIIARIVRQSLEEQNETRADKPKLSHILVITFINPLLPLLPTLMTIAYTLAHFEISL